MKVAGKAQRRRATDFGSSFFVSREINKKLIGFRLPKCQFVFEAQVLYSLLQLGNLLE